MNRAIWLLSLAGFMAAAATRACDALLPSIAESFSVSVSAAVLAITSFTFAYGAFQLVYGPVGTRVGPYRLAAIATLLAASGTFACAMADSLTWLVAGRFWSGLTAAAIIPMSLAYIGDTVDYHNRQGVIARFLLGQVLGIVFGQAFAGVFAQLLSWRQLFLLLGVGFLLVGVFLVRELNSGRVVRHSKVSIAGNPLRQYLRVLQRPWALVVLLTVGLEGFFSFGAYPYVAAQLRFRFGLEYLSIGVIMSGFGLGAFIYILAVRVLLRRLGETGLVYAGGGLMFSGFVLMAIAPIWHIYVFTVILIGHGLYMLHNTLQTNATQMAPFDRSAAISLFAFSLFVGQAAGATALGHMGELTGYNAVFLLSATALLLLAWVFVYLRKRYAHLPASEDAS